MEIKAKRCPKHEPLRNVNTAAFVPEMFMGCYSLCIVMYVVALVPRDDKAKGFTVCKSQIIVKFKINNASCLSFRPKEESVLSSVMND